MTTTKLKRPISISITSEESNILDQLKLKGVSTVSVFRRGLMDIAEENNLTLDS